MPPLDAQRLATWRDLQAIVAELTRSIDADLQEEWAVPLGSFDVLDTLRRIGGRVVVSELAQQMRLPPSSLSRRLDRLVEEGWVARHRQVEPGDRRLVAVELTPRGRALWRDMRLTYRRSVQRRFASRLDDDEILALRLALDGIDD